MLLDSFLVKIGVDADTEKLQKFKNGIDNTLSSVKNLAVGLSASLGGAVLFVQKSLEGLDEIAQLSRVTGEASENIQILGMIATTAGSSVQATNSSIEGLSRVIGEAVNGVGLGAKAFEHYGLSAKKSNGDVKSATEMMEELRLKMEGMSKQSQIAMLSKLGIDKSMIQVLRMTNEEMAQAQENARKLSLGTGSKENVDESASLQDSLAEFWQMLKAMSEYISLQFSPVIRQAVELFKQWFITNNEDLKKSLKTIADNIVKAIKIILILVKAIDDVISSTIGWDKAVMGLAVAFGALMAIFAPVKLGIMLVVGALTGLYMLWQDFQTFLSGGDSLFHEYWQPLIDLLKPIIQYYKALWQVVKDVAKVFASAFTLDDKALIESLKNLKNSIIKMFGSLGNVISKPFLKCFDFIQKKFNGILEPIFNKTRKTMEFLGIVDKKEEPTVQQVKGVRKDKNLGIQDNQNSFISKYSYNKLNEIDNKLPYDNLNPKKTSLYDKLKPLSTTIANTNTSIVNNKSMNSVRKANSINNDNRVANNTTNNVNQNIHIVGGNDVGAIKQATTDGLNTALNTNSSNKI